MSDADRRVRELFVHFRRAIDVIEELMLQASPVSAQPSRPESQSAPPSSPPIPRKVAYSIKEVRDLIAISNSSIYKEIGAGRLRAVKRGNRTMILDPDLQAWIRGWPASGSSGKPKSRRLGL
jgi:hypothetical protein